MTLGVWMLVLLCCVGISTAENITSSDCDEEVNIYVSNRRRQADSPGKGSGENGTTQIEQKISKQININLNLDSIMDLTRERAALKNTPVNDSYSDSPNPFYDYVRGFGYYKLHSELKTWNEAKAICEKEGAHLAIINSKKEIQIFQELRNRLPKLWNDGRDGRLYIGISDFETEGTWVTVLGHPVELTGFSEWDAGEPGSTTLENCGAIRLSTSKLHDYPCSQQLGFYCEKEL